MNTIEQLKLDAEAAGIRARTMLRTAVGLIGILAVLLGAYNLLVTAAVAGATPVLAAAYAEPLGLGGAVVSPLAHVVLMATGATIAWFC